MWAFFRNRKTAQDTPEKRQRPKSLEQLVDDIGEFSDLATNDVALKFWLPEPAKYALDEISEITNQSVSSSMRQFLMIHCYGFYPYLVMAESMPNFCKDSDPMFSIPEVLIPEGKIRVSTYWVADLGKNIAPIKVWIPKRLKQDLSILAEHVDLTLSNYVREITISRLLGHGMLPKRPEMMAVPTGDADNWIEDKPLNWIEVDAKVYKQFGVKEIRDELVDDTG